MLICRSILVPCCHRKVDSHRFNETIADKLILVQVMACCLSQCWAWSMSPYGFTWSQWLMLCYVWKLKNASYAILAIRYNWCTCFLIYTKTYHFILPKNVIYFSVLCSMRIPHISTTHRHRSSWDGWYRVNTFGSIVVETWWQVIRDQVFRAQLTLRSAVQRFKFRNPHIILLYWQRKPFGIANVHKMYGPTQTSVHARSTKYSSS